MRVLALDWGTVRIGGAITDELGKIAFPMEKFIESKNATSEIKKIVDEKDVQKIIVGLPKNLSGEDTDSTKLVEEFAKELKEKVGVEVEFFDERFSSVGATKTLSNQGLSKKSSGDWSIILLRRKCYKPILTQNY